MPASPDPAPDRIGRAVRERPERLAVWALLSWFLGALLGILELSIGLGGFLWPLVVLPIFVLTIVASVALFQRDPERAGLDAFRFALLSAIPSTLLVGRAAVRAFESPSFGRLSLVCMTSASIGAVVGAIAGPVLGWALRRAARALIRRESRR